MKTLKDFDFKDKIVLVRADYNVPLARGDDGKWQVGSDLRIRASLPTLEYLRKAGAKKIIIISHLGRPEGKSEDLSLTPVAERLAYLLAEEADSGIPPVVEFVEDFDAVDIDETGVESAREGNAPCSGKLDLTRVKSAVDELPDGGIILLENLRFDPREKANDTDFAKEIIEATGAEIFVQDGFAVTHRAHTSTEALARLLSSAAGILVEKEVEELGHAIENPERPFVVIIGGAKVEDKQPLIDQFLPLADQVLVGGKIAADGYTANDPKIYVAEDFDEDASGNKLDIGPFSTGKFLEILSEAKTVLWNGVLGKTEDPAFATSSEMIAKYLGERRGTRVIVCGGDTTGFIEGLMEQYPELEFDLISTGGGAALEFLLGAKMPGLKVLK